MNKSYIKCPECNTVNLNNEFCSNCGALLDLVLKRQIETEKKIQFKIDEQEKTKKPASIFEIYFNKGLEHSNILIRYFFQAIYSIWLFFAVVIGGIIAAVTAAAAG
ncbi:hypothetical protein SAMN05444396_102409 [Flavobacterium segetis]|uniref:Zinc-ribbon domain-containing protein n=1 Tax=Flavobacterium segetis TaxID=271157 RepID=A0A1M5FIG3_9FLAO|nr:hypothetical protein [Flavobacterium segetis]SHF91276.1 hypothetical protein SAMN05444396_102409 [Flavobacterium segetis]